MRMIRDPSALPDEPRILPATDAAGHGTAEVIMVRKLVWATLVVALASALGCRGTGMPQFFGPGSAKYQQTQAQRFDPYPETDIGPPVEGSRPDSFSAPPTEAYRGRVNQWSAPAYGS